MSIRIHITHQLNHDTLARVLMVDPPDPATRTTVRRTVSAILAELGERGALRQYLRIRRAAVAGGVLDEHLRALAACREQIEATYPPPRPRTARPQPQGAPLIDVLAEPA